jgi:hypothetical protein
MIYNILNGDSLAYSFADAKIPGETIVMREGLIDGDLTGDSLNDFWQARARYMEITDEEYNEAVVKELKKIMNAPDNTEFNGWFEYDLFCQVNWWFLLSVIRDLPIQKKVFAVYTAHVNEQDKQFWNGFGQADTSQLITCFENRVLLSDADLQLGQELWNAYKKADLKELSRLAENQSPAFPYIREVVQAHVDRFPEDGGKGRPEKVLEDITRNISTDFHKVFVEFWKRESIYGFGDTQLKKIYDNVVH